MSNIKKRPISMILRNYYPRAFVMHQDVMFRVDGPGQALAGITKNDVESTKLMNKLRHLNIIEKVWDKILDELKILGFDIEDIKTQMKFCEDEGFDKINVIVPSKVDLRLDQGLNVGRCERCGHLNYLDHILRNYRGLPVHQDCKITKNPKYKQAPVFVPYPKNQKSRTRPGSRDTLRILTVLPVDVNCKYLGQNQRCNHPKSNDRRCVTEISGQHSYMHLNPNYPLSGIKIVNNNCPKGLTDIKPKPMTPIRPGAEYAYKKQFADSGVTGRLYTTIAWEDTKQNESINQINQIIEPVKKTWFSSELVDLDETKFSNIGVIDLVYGVRIGGYYDHFLGGCQGKNNILGRMLQTQGFVITIKDAIWNKALSLTNYQSNTVDPVEDRVRIIVHSLEHAILNQIPTYTGIEETKFGGSFEILKDQKGARIYLFDNETGGHGGFATLINNYSRFTKMIQSVYNQIKCPIRQCRTGCKHCLFLRNCGLLNYKLHRKMLLDSGILLRQ